MQEDSQWKIALDGVGEGVQLAKRQKGRGKLEKKGKKKKRL